MSNGEGKRLLAEIQISEFVGRDHELDLLYRHASSEASPSGILLLSAPSAGASELLRQTYDRLFREQREIIPFYFALSPSDKTAVNAATRYLQQFLLQTVAFRRREPALLDSSPEICEVTELAPASDADWINRLTETRQKESRLNNDQGFIRNSISAPLRAAAQGARVFVIVDDLHDGATFEDGALFVDELVSVFSRNKVPFVFSARRGLPISSALPDKLLLDPLDFQTAGIVIEKLAKASAVAVNEQTRDLIAVQFAGNPRLINLLILAARETQKTLDSFQNVERLYANELVAGRLAAYFKNILDAAALDPATAQKLVELLRSSLEPDAGRFTLDSWERRLGLHGVEFRRLISILELNEFIHVESASAKAAGENEILRDYIAALYRLDNAGDSRAAVTAHLVTTALKRAPRLMAGSYRRQTAANLQKLLAEFDCQEIPASLLDYQRFRETYKGLTDEEVRDGLASETEHYLLPQISHSAAVSEYDSSIRELIEPDRTAFGAGFTDKSYTDDSQIAWIAVEIDSKMEADRELTEFWCDRLDRAAELSGTGRFNKWLIAPEGFSPESLQILSQRNAIGSSRRQVDMLRTFLRTGEFEAESTASADYEITIPIGDDMELIAAHTLEEIAKRSQFPAKSINQIKTALVEACINASEHSLSPDRKIYQRFSVYDDRIVITVSNRGIRLTDRNAVEIESPEGRRGWGLNLIRSLMDDVKIEQVDDGTRISMTKFLKPAE